MPRFYKIPAVNARRLGFEPGSTVIVRPARPVIEPTGASMRPAERYYRVTSLDGGPGGGVITLSGWKLAKLPRG